MPMVPDSVMIEGEPFNNGLVVPSSSQTVSAHTLSTASTLVQILQKGNTAVANQNTALESHVILSYGSEDGVCLSDTNICGANDTIILSGAVAKAMVDDSVPDATAIALAEDNGLFPNLEDNTLPLLNGDDSNISLDNG